MKGTGNNVIGVGSGLSGISNGDAGHDEVGTSASPIIQSVITWDGSIVALRTDGKVTLDGNGYDGNYTLPTNIQTTAALTSLLAAIPTANTLQMSAISSSTNSLPLFNSQGNYTISHVIGSVKNGDSAAEAMQMLKANPSAFFPFPISGGPIQEGNVYHLSPLFPVPAFAGDLKATNVTDTSFTLVPFSAA